MSEKRKTPRQKSLLRGLVYFDGSPVSVECVVRDISDAGARLRFRDDHPRAGTLELKIPIKGQAFKGCIRWQQDNEIGIAFTVATTVGTADRELTSYVVQLEAEIVELKEMIMLLQKDAGKKIEAA